jgi:SAM-dependent methyltransferase
MLRRLAGSAMAPFHDWVRRRSDHPVQQARQMLEHLMRAGENRGILVDVGAGAEAFRLAPYWQGRRIALDLRFSDDVDVMADGQALPLLEGSVDAVLLMEVLEHVPDPLCLLQECARILRPSGHLCLTVPQYHILHNHPADYFRFTRHGIELLCERAGFQIVAVQARGGPFLVVFHAVELNLPPRLRVLFVAATYALFEGLDRWLCGHGNRPGVRDAVGWTLLGTKKGLGA